MTAFMTAIAYFLVPLALTAALEAIVGLCFGLSKKEQLMLLLINCVTNLSLNLLLYIYGLLFSCGASIATYALEVAVVLTEWRLMKAFSPGRKNVLLFSFVANACSFGFGLLLPLILS